MSTVLLTDALTRAQRGEHAAVCAELTAMLADPLLSVADRLPVLITLGTAQYYAGEYPVAVESCSRAIELAEELEASGEQAYVHSVRASVRIELADRQAATDDLLQAELLLTRVDADDPLGDRIRRSLAGSYSELEMFELAAAHQEQVQPDPDQLIADTINASNLRLRWARFLHRMSTDDELTTERRQHLLLAAAGLDKARSLMIDGPRTWAPLVDKMWRETAAQLDPATGVGPLQELIADRVDTGLANTTAVSLATLVTALRRLGRIAESVEAGQQAMTLIDDHRMFAETVSDVLFAVHRTQQELGVDGAANAASYLAAAGELALLRQERVDAYTALLDHELRKQELSDLSARAHRDPLTGLSNRRALDAWFDDHPQGPAVLAVSDLNNFKSINDTFGYGVGDAVLRRFAAALQRTLAARATVVRLGGDEFVIVSAPAGSDAGTAGEAGLSAIAHQTAEQIRSSARDLRIDDLAPGLRLSASVGVHTATAGQDTRSLLHRADRHMYNDKGSGRPVRRT